MTRPARNGVDVPSVFAVIEGVKGQSGMAQFQFRAGNKWIRRNPQPFRHPGFPRARPGGHQPNRTFHL